MMNKFFDFIDRHKYGVIAAFMVYIAMFMYLQLKSVPDYFEIKAFNQGARLENPKDELEINSDNIEVPSDFTAGNITNTVRDMNDSRSRSKEDWSATKSDEEYDQMMKEQEQKMFSESGGEEKRQAMLQEFKNQEELNKKNTQNQQNSKSKNSENAIEGNVMVEWNLKGRKPHNNDEWHVRNPGYKCGRGSNGRVVVTIKVGRDGRVKNADIDYASTQNANDCMLRQAKQYAEMSRFNYSSAGGETQVGKIYYTFISQ